MWEEALVGVEASDAVKITMKSLMHVCIKLHEDTCFSERHSVDWGATQNANIFGFSFLFFLHSRTVLTCRISDSLQQEEAAGADFFFWCHVLNAQEVHVSQLICLSVCSARYVTSVSESVAAPSASQRPSNRDESAAVITAKNVDRKEKNDFFFPNWLLFSLV